MEQQDIRGPGLVLMENVWDILPPLSECVSVCGGVFMHVYAYEYKTEVNACPLQSLSIYLFMYLETEPHKKPGTLRLS